MLLFIQAPILLEVVYFIFPKIILGKEQDYSVIPDCIYCTGKLSEVLARHLNHSVQFSFYLMWYFLCPKCEAQ